MEDYKYCVICPQGFASGKKATTGELLTFVKDGSSVQAVYRYDDGSVSSNKISNVRLFKTAEEADKSAKAHNKSAA